MSKITGTNPKPGEENCILPAVFLSFKTPVLVLLAITILYLVIQLGSMLSQGPEPVEVLVPRYNISPYSLILDSDLELKAFNKTDLPDLAVINANDSDGINYTGGSYYSLKSLEAGKPLLLSDIKRASLVLQNNSVVGIRVTSAAALGRGLMAGERVSLYSTAKDTSVLGPDRSVLKAVVLDITPMNCTNLSGSIDLVLAISNNETDTMAKMMPEDFLIARDMHGGPIARTEKEALSYEDNATTIS